MPLVALDLTLTVAAALAAFLLGFLAWWRNKWSTGSVAFGLLSISLALWTSVDWFLRLSSTALPLQFTLWKILFFASVCLGPACVLHAAAALAHRYSPREISAAYAFGLVTFFTLAFAEISRLVGMGIPANVLRGVQSIGALFGILLYLGALLCASVESYPILFSQTATTTDRRRASYGLLILSVYTVAGILQLVSGPVPTGFLMPFFALLFVGLALTAFARASFLDIRIGSLEVFLLPLIIFFLLSVLRASDMTELSVSMIGLVLIGSFGSLAIRNVENEHVRRMVVEERNRQLKEIDQAKSDFVDMVSHQLRTPLSAIRGSASLIENGDYGAVPLKVKEAVAQIGDASTRLLSLSETFLNKSRLDVGLYKSQRLPTDLRSEVTKIMQEMTLVASGKGLKITLALPRDIPRRVLIDAEVLRNALFNILDNAIKYTDQGTIDIVCSITPSEFTFDVRDTGEGMTPEDQAELFKKFHRGRVGRSHELDGTGLGLYVVKRLVEAAGGRIYASSSGPDTGSVFTVSLPVSGV